MRRHLGEAAVVHLRRAATAAALAAVLSIAACTGEPAGRRAAPASPGRGGFHAGTAGIGDAYFPNYGNGGYDVGHYAIKIKYDPATDEMVGDVTIKATATADLSQFNLDFTGLTVRSVTVNDASSAHRRTGEELVVTPSAGLPKGAEFTTRIAYDGRPGGLNRPGLGAVGFLHTADGAVVIGEPESASTWYPVNDHPQDKATYTIEITVPAGLAVVSNGVLEHTATAGGQSTTTWQVRSPMASYLSTLAIGEYRIKTGTHDGKPVVTAVAQSLPVGPADAAMARTAEIADFLATQFGPYPFDAYGGIVIDDSRVRFALETQTRPIYSAKFFAAGDNSSDNSRVVAHELAHQWYGDSVSVHHWQDIWLNEGFATYAEWLWSEHEGRGSVQSLFEREYANSDTSVWQTPPADPGRDDIFSRSVYRRGAMALQALRLTVGDADFFRIIRSWAAEKRDGNATTAEFMAHAERISGKSLRPLFDAWLYAKVKPSLPTGS